MSGTASDPNPSEDSRLTSLEQRLDRAEAVEAERTAGSASPESDANYRLGNRVLAELLGGVGGGALVGWVIDRFAGTAPWGLLVVLFLGIVVAFRNIWRISSGRPPSTTRPD
jgi:ATP synthase protein I